MSWKRLKSPVCQGGKNEEKLMNVSSVMSDSSPDELSVQVATWLTGATSVGYSFIVIWDDP